MIRERSNPYSKKAAAETKAAPAYSSRRKKARVNLFGEKVSKEDTDYKIMRAYESQQVADPFAQQYTNSVMASGHSNILPPPYNPYALIRFPNENNTLRQCIDAMVINIESMGHRFEYVGPEGAEDGKEALTEKARLDALVTQPNGEYGLLELRERRRRDLETFGYCYLEVCRASFKKDIVSYYHVPAETVRLTAADTEETECVMWLNRDGKYVQQKIKRRFRRYVQEIGTRKVYFKEFGDPRVIDSKTGAVMDKDSDNADAATEIICTNLYNPGSPYGAPRYINQLPAILGSRESELTNLQFFKDNAIPAMAILVSGGSLTGDSVDEIEEHIYSVQGRNSVHRVMILEAQGSETAAGPDKSLPAPKLEVKPLTGERQNDALFQEYDKNNSVKVRSSFRLSPMLLGVSEDVTYAVAEASLVVAEGQVFGPERNKTDDIFNNQILSDADGRPPKFWRFRSNPPRIADPKTIVDALKTFDAMGAMTPNVAIGIANELFDLNIKTVDEDWGNYPYQTVQALLGKGELIGMDEIRKEVEKVEPLGVADAQATGLSGKELEEIEKTLLEPLRKLVGANDVRVLRKKIRKRNVRK